MLRGRLAMTVRTDRARYGVMPTPSYDSFETVTVTVNAPGGGFAFTDELTVSQAYALAS